MTDTTVDDNTGGERGLVSGVAVPGYTILGELGRGGMGAVFRARDRTGNEVALKVITSPGPQFKERFAREIRAAQQVPSPHIVRVLAFGLEPIAFMATEIVDGGSVRDILDGSGALPVPLALRLFDDLLAGLGAAHAEGILHRDVKPQNLLVAADGKLKVADFGVAHLTDASSLTSTGGIVGTPAYMSPEQALAENLDAGSDVFSAGIVLYEMLTGEHPFRADSPAATLLRITRLRHRLASEVAPLIPDDVDSLVERLLRDRLRRIASAAAARAALAPLLTQYGASRDDVAAYLKDTKATRARSEQEFRAAEIKAARRALATKHLDVVAATTARLVRAWPRDPDVMALFRDVRRTVTIADRPSIGALTLLRRAEKEESPVPTLKEAARQAKKEGDATLERIAHAHVLQVIDDDESVSVVLPARASAPGGVAQQVADGLVRVALFPLRVFAALWNALMEIAPSMHGAQSIMGRNGIFAIAFLILFGVFGSCAMCGQCASPFKQYQSLVPR